MEPPKESQDMYLIGNGSCIELSIFKLEVIRLALEKFYFDRRQAPSEMSDPVAAELEKETLQTATQLDDTIHKLLHYSPNQ